MIRVRKESEALTEGQYATIESPEKNLYVFERKSSTQKVIVILNLSSDGVISPIDLSNYDKLIGNYEEPDSKIRPWEAIVLKKEMTSR